MLAFIADGIRRNEKCIVVIPEYPVWYWADGLKRTGVDTDDQRLRVLSPSELYSGTGDNRAEAAVSTIHRVVDEAASGLLERDSDLHRVRP